ncbi:capsular biosynthesis protein [Glutamicibacter soli]|uniref:Capsular biosynthesis protein n=1 Tax=Glutamicibacter soli TaxID=453836 RepID=A0A365YAA8_9MICC|nr:stealth family protein [Glutamicibacter soli]RBL99630.1 capsular biosynthesis protein [Glutamicibacter soli]
MNRAQLKSQAKQLVGLENYLMLRECATKIKKLSRSATVQFKQVQANRSKDKDSLGGRKGPLNTNLVWQKVHYVTADDAYLANWNTVVSILESAQVRWWSVRTETDGRQVIGINIQDRNKILEYLKKYSRSTSLSTYAMNPMAKNPQYLLQVAENYSEIKEAEVLRICTPLKSELDGRNYGFAFGCDLEFWVLNQDVVRAPRENKASKEISQLDFELVPTELNGRTVYTPKVFLKRMLDDFNFEVDVVYTWVDGNDPKWKSKKDACMGIPHSDKSEFHAEAVSDSRFESRDELKYSLRSIALFAPWVRNIYIVTDDQIPSWLDTDNPRIKIIDHKEIMKPENLPTFNSNAIISNIHHIPGLSEHFIFFNDDVMLGQRVSKSDFFTPSGIALVSRSNNRRPFGDPSLEYGPHFNITRNIRRILEEQFGVTISRAIKHTPHPLMKSVMYEMEELFESEFEKTSASKFRHHEDIVADQLHHYYAQIVGKAVPGNLTYNYINILNDQFINVMRNTLVKRNRKAFCINDAPEPGATPIPEWEIMNFFNTYFPKESEFEI